MKSGKLPNRSLREIRELPPKERAKYEAEFSRQMKPIIAQLAAIGDDARAKLQPLQEAAAQLSASLAPIRAAFENVRPIFAEFLRGYVELERRVYERARTRFTRPDGSLDYDRLYDFVNRVNFGALPPERLEDKSPYDAYMSILDAFDWDDQRAEDRETDRWIRETTKKNDKTLGQTLRDLRIAKGWATYKRAHNETGIDRNLIMAYETDKIVPGEKNLSILAKTYSVELSALTKLVPIQS